MEKRKASDDGAGALIKRSKESSDIVLAPTSNGAGAIIKQVQRTSALHSPIMLLSGHQSEVLSCKFSPAGDTVASASFDRSILLWNTYGECVNKLQLLGHKGAVLEVQWSRDGSSVYSASTDKTVGVWDAKTGERVRRLKGHGSFVNTVAVARRGGEMIASGSDDNTIRLWDLRTKYPVNTLQERFQVTATAWNEDASILFSGGIDNEIKAWDVRKNEVVYTLQGHLDTITGLRLSPDGSNLLSNAMDNTARIWDVKPFSAGSSRLLKIFEGAPHGMEKHLLKPCWSNDGEFIAAGSADRSVVVWDVSTRRIVYKLPGHKGCVTEVDWHPKEPIIVSSSNDKTLFLGELNPAEVKYLWRNECSESVLELGNLALKDLAELSVSDHLPERLCSIFHLHLPNHSHILNLLERWWTEGIASVKEMKQQYSNGTTINDHPVSEVINALNNIMGLDAILKCQYALGHEFLLGAMEGIPHESTKISAIKMNMITCQKMVNPAKIEISNPFSDVLENLMNRERIMDNIMMSLLAIHNRSCFRLRMERQTGYVHIRDMVKDLSRVLPSIKSILRCSSQSAVRKSLKVKPGLLGSESLEEKTTSADGSTISDAEEARMGSALYELLETVFDEQIEVSNEVTSFSRGDGNNSINGSVANSWSLISKAAVPKLKQGKLGLSLSDLNALRVVACKIVWLAAVAGFDKAVQRHSLKTDNMATGTHFFSLIVHLRDLMNNVIPKDNGLINAMDTKSMLKLHFVQMQSSLMQAQTVTEMLLLWVKLHFPDKVPLLEENNVDELQKASISRLEIWPSYQTKFAGHVAMMKGNLVDALEHYKKYLEAINYKPEMGVVYRLGCLSYFQSDLEAAVTYFRAMNDEVPENMHANLGIAMVFRKVGLVNEERRELMEVLKIARDRILSIPEKSLPVGFSVHRILLRCIELLEQENLGTIDDKDLDIISTFLNEIPNSKSEDLPFSVVLSYYSAMLCRLGKLDTARLFARRAILLDKNDAVACLVLGRCALHTFDKMKQKKLKDAMEDYFAIDEGILSLERIGVEFDVFAKPSNEAASKKRKREENEDGLTKIEKKARDQETYDSLYVLSSQIDCEPKIGYNFLDNHTRKLLKAETLSNLGVFNWKKGNMETATKLLDEAYCIAPNLSSICYNTCLLLHRIGKLEKASERWLSFRMKAGLKERMDPRLWRLLADAMVVQRKNLQESLRDTGYQQLYRNLREIRSQDIPTASCEWMDLIAVREQVKKTNAFQKT